MAEHKPTAEQRNNVEVMSGYGLPYEQIAIVVGISKPTLIKHYRADLDRGLARINLQIGRSTVQQAVGSPAEYDTKGRVVREEIKPDKSVAIFMSKVRLGYRENIRVEVDFLDRYDLSKLSTEELELVLALLTKAQRRADSEGPAD